MWGRLSVCGRLAIGPASRAKSKRPIANRPQDGILPHTQAQFEPMLACGLLCYESTPISLHVFVASFALTGAVVGRRCHRRCARFAPVPNLRAGLRLRQWNIRTQRPDHKTIPGRRNRAIEVAMEILGCSRISIRTHQDFSYSGEIRGTSGANYGTVWAASANTWLFPLLIRYDFMHSRISPFADAGATLRRLGPFDGNGYQLNSFLQPQQETIHIEPNGNPAIAITAGAGVRPRIW